MYAVHVVCLCTCTCTCVCASIHPPFTCNSTPSGNALIFIDALAVRSTHNRCRFADVNTYSHACSLSLSLSPLSPSSLSSLSLSSPHSCRADVENQYVNGIHKIAKKAKKATKRCLGTTLEPAWQKFIGCLETDEEHHRSLAASLSQDCAKAMKAFTDQQVKTREPVREWRGGRKE